MQDDVEQRAHAHGGARQGAGRPKKYTGDGSDPYMLLARAKAKRETHKAQIAELEYKKMAGDLALMSEVMQLYTTTVAVFAEQMRSLPDMLERKAGLTPAQAEMAADFVDEQLEQLELRLVKRLNGDAL